MNDLDNPHVRELVGLLLMLPGDWKHPVWRSINEDNDHRDLFGQISPLVRMLGGGEGRPAGSLVYEVLDAFSDLSEGTRRLIGEQVGGLGAGVTVGDVWVAELLTVAVRARAGALPETLGLRAQAWGRPR
ncbi:hypothetical protein KGD82_16540 [Nocardiopsis eucommiae]|uniref:Uncharacterized protein n=1 Tax=Nocardiopsis eucommiae TaxID=2831970 RepID=A0A975L7J9_9ACTN|nr:hypothetical protein KGD82_16540 [Nocardiopsis eucommiae]